jgi:uncharacterized protein YpbB
MLFTKAAKTKQLLRDLLSKAILFGVSKEAELMVEEYIQYNEFGLAFEQIVYELNENGISINNYFYAEMKNVGDLLKLNENEYNDRLEKLIIK